MGFCVHIGKRQVHWVPDLSVSQGTSETADPALEGRKELEAGRLRCYL